MAETLYTPDGRLHALLGTTTLESIVRDYTGDQAADLVLELMKADAYERARAETDLGNYERSLDHWQRVAQGWADEIDSTLLETKKSTRETLRSFLLALNYYIKSEL